MYYPTYELYDFFGGPLHGHRQIHSATLKSIAVEDRDVAHVYFAVGAALFYAHVCTLVRLPRPAQDEMSWVWTI